MPDRTLERFYYLKQMQDSGLDANRMWLHARKLPFLNQKIVKELVAEFYNQFKTCLWKTSQLWMDDLLLLGIGCLSNESKVYSAITEVLWRIKGDDIAFMQEQSMDWWDSARVSLSEIV